MDAIQTIYKNLDKSIQDSIICELSLGVPYVLAGGPRNVLDPLLQGELDRRGLELHPLFLVPRDRILAD